MQNSLSADSTFTTPPINLNQAVATTSSASSITQTTATLNGVVNPNGSNATVEFEYGTSNGYGNTVSASQSPVNGSSSVNVSADISGLSPNTLYHFRIKAANSSGTAYGADSTFKTKFGQTIAVTGSASDFTANSATLNGIVNPGGLSTSVQFEYGTSNIYGNNVTAAQSPVSGSNEVNVSAVINGLSVNTIYHYRIDAININGTINGEDSTFTIIIPSNGSPPVATTGAASNETQTGAILNGVVNPGDLSTAVQFDYGTTTNYGSSIVATQSPVNGNINVNVSADLTGLFENTTYHYRVKATNSKGTIQGSDIVFRTTYTYPATIPLTQIYSFSDYTKNSSYKLIGLPGNLNGPLISILGDTSGQHWDAYYDNGVISTKSSDYLIHFNNSSVFNFKPGNGFWIIGDKSLNISQNATAVSLKSGYYEIQLHNGWNIISNPFVKSVVWDSVRGLNSLSNDTLWGWSAGWHSSSIFLPFQAYYFL